MKPSKNDRRRCEIVRDFLVGLALFLAVFTLAMLDSRASRSAPAPVSKPATISWSQALTAGYVTTGNLSLPLPASEELPVNSPSVQIYSRTTGPEEIAEHARMNSKLAMKTGKPGAGPYAPPGTPEGSGRIWLLIVMALIFAAMTALTLGLWRHLRRSVVARGNERRV